MINIENFSVQMENYGKEKPFDHCVIDNFFNDDALNSITNEFPDFSSNAWHNYDNALEIKKTCNNWNMFPENTYKLFEYLNSIEFIGLLSQLTNISPLFADPGLNGGGWHIHKSGGKLNTHLDYSIHPKLNKQRILNILVYLTPNWQEDWGGHLGLWEQDKNAKKPGELSKSILPKYNRAVIFNTTQDSWHGLPEPIMCPDNIFRRSIAVYYLTDPEHKTDPRGKALFAPYGDQNNEPEILELIKKRSSVEMAKTVYQGDK